MRNSGLPEEAVVPAEWKTDLFAELAPVRTGPSCRAQADRKRPCLSQAGSGRPPVGAAGSELVGRKGQYGTR